MVDVIDCAHNEMESQNEACSGKARLVTISTNPNVMAPMRTRKKTSDAGDNATSAISMNKRMRPKLQTAIIKGSMPVLTLRLPYYALSR